jgi:hypothetical protein
MHNIYTAGDKGYEKNDPGIFTEAEILDIHINK